MPSQNGVTNSDAEQILSFPVSVTLDLLLLM